MTSLCQQRRGLSHDDRRTFENGTVRVRFTYFHLNEGEESCVAVTFRSTDEEMPVLGTVDKHTELRWQDENVTTLEHSVSGTAAGILLSWIEPDREPTMHLLKELADLRQELVERNISVVLITGTAGTGKSLKTEQIEMLPPQVRLGEASPASLPEVFRSSGATESGYPIWLFWMRFIRFVISHPDIGLVL